MSNTLPNTTRRTFLKGLAYGSALSLGGISTALVAANVSKTKANINGSALPTCDISIKANQMIGTEIITLTNHTHSNVKINNITGVGLEHVNKHLTVKINKLGKHANTGIVNLSPGENLSFVVAALSCDDCGNANNKNVFIPNMLAGQLKVSSDHPNFNGIIPLTVFETA